MKRDGWLAAALWLALTAVGEAAVWNPRIFPGGYAREADVSDSAFRLLMRLAVPVFAFVLAVLVVSVVRHRAKGKPAEDGPPVAGSRAVYALWLAVTSALAVVLIVNPGLVGLSEIRGEAYEDMVVHVQAAQWAWTVTYPDEGVTSRAELVLPVDTRVRFDVTSVDVLHSFWIPAFRMKVDAVPGMTTSVRVTTTRAGSFPDDPGLRIQCAELCGLNHATMAMPVRVLDEAGFRAWLDEQRRGGAPACEPTGTELAITAQDILFDTDCLAVAEGTPFTIVFDNRDGVPHNVAIYTDEAATEALFKGEIFEGPEARTYRVGPLEAGTYFFRCDVHPGSMFGTFVVARPPPPAPSPTKEG